MNEPTVIPGEARIALVTGCAGFIGSHLIDRLIADGARVICLDNLHTGRIENLSHLKREARFDFIEHDVTAGLPHELFKGSAKLTHIYHLACPASPVHYQADPEQTLLTNVLGTRNALRLAEDTGARFLLTSTSEVYGDPDVHPQPEDNRGSVSCTGPRACYDEGKRAAETLAFDYARAGRAAVRVARIFNTYGPRMRSDDGRVVSNFVCQALAGEDVTIYGDGSQTRSLCYVDDMVEGLERLMQCAGVSGPVNLGNPNELAINALVARILAITGSNAGVIYQGLPEDDPRRRKPDISRAMNLLDWRPAIDLDQGLEATVAWFRQEMTPSDCPVAVGSSAIATAAE
jgi:UDP-glucuronate decarboxylase